MNEQLPLPDAIGRGVFVAVVGPSGAGKDTVIGYARQRLEGHPRFSFVRRVVTRVADRRSEDHDTLSEADFLEAALAGRFALCWAAHDHRYGIPQDVDDAVADGLTVIANLSRSVVPEARQRYENALLVHVSAHPEVIALRLAERGREDADAIARRIRQMELEEHDRADAVRLENSGPIELAGERFVNLLLAAAEAARKGRPVDAASLYGAP